MTNVTENKILPSIYALFKKTISDAESSPDIHDIVQKTFDGIAEEDYGHYLKQALSRLVYTDVNLSRKSSLTSLQSASGEQKTPVYKRGKGQVLNTYVTNDVSPKQKDISDARAEFFASLDRSADGRTIRLGESTYDDLVFQAERLQLHGEMTLENAKTRKKWAKAVESNGVKTLEELPQDVLTKLGI